VSVFEVAGLGPPPRLTDEEKEQIKAFMQAVAAVQVGWREQMTGQWAFLYCTCCTRYHGPECQVADGCPVHGRFMITKEGRIL